MSPAIDPATRTGLLYADLPEPGPLRAGMFAEGRILLGSVPASVVPRESVVFRDGFAYLFVVKAVEGTEAGSALRRVEQRRVDIGVRQGDFTEILSGLEPGRTRRTPRRRLSRQWRCGPRGQRSR